jgi:hypothetical protein
MRKLLRLAALCAFGFSLSGTASAALIYAGYPPPGGVTLGTTTPGVFAIDAGGHTNTFTGFNTAAYGSLYYVLDASHFTPYLGQSSGDTLTFNSALSNFAGGQVAFTGTTVLSTLGGGVPVFSELLVTLTDPSLNPLALTDATTLGIPSADGAALNVTGNFDANLQFLFSTSCATAQSCFTSAQNVYNSYNTLNINLLSSANGGFYYTAPVPLPAALWLLVSGLTGIGVIGRRRPRTLVKL